MAGIALSFCLSVASYTCHLWAGTVVPRPGVRLMGPARVLLVVKVLPAAGLQGAWGYGRASALLVVSGRLPGSRVLNGTAFLPCCLLLGSAVCDHK